MPMMRFGHFWTTFSSGKFVFSGCPRCLIRTWLNAQRLMKQSSEMGCHEVGYIQLIQRSSLPLNFYLFSAVFLKWCLVLIYPGWFTATFSKSMGYHPVAL